MKTLMTHKLVDAVRDVEFEKWNDSAMASRLAWVTLATLLTCGFEMGAGINQMQKQLDEMTEKYLAELEQLKNEKVGA